MITCEFENGNRAALRHVTVDGIVVDESGRVVLVKRAPGLIEAGKWAMPGGYLDRDETAHEGVRREVLEETGYEASVLELLQIVTLPNRPNEGGRQNVCMIFVMSAGEKVGKPDAESTEIRWFPLDDLPLGELAFDHADTLDIYRGHLAQAVVLPVID